MSITATREIPKKKTVRAVKQQRDYDDLYGECITEQKAPPLRNVLVGLTLACCFAADPVFTVSSEVDHYRSRLKARASKGPVVSCCSFSSESTTLCSVINIRCALSSRVASYFV